MSLMLIGVSLYLTYYTFTLAKKAWREGSRGAGLVIALMSGCYLPLSIYMHIR